MLVGLCYFLCQFQKTLYIPSELYQLALSKSLVMGLVFYSLVLALVEELCCLHNPVPSALHSYGELGLAFSTAVPHFVATTVL